MATFEPNMVACIICFANNFVSYLFLGAYRYSMDMDLLLIFCHALTQRSYLYSSSCYFGLIGSCELDVSILGICILLVNVVPFLCAKS